MEGDISGRIKNWWDNLPSFSRFMFYFLPSIYIISIFTSYLYLLFVNIPIAVTLHLQLWRIFTAPFISLSIFHMLFMTLSFVQTAGRLERQFGTARFTVLFFLNAALLESLYAILGTGLTYTGFFLFQYMISAGLWPLIFVDMVIWCNQDPEMNIRNICCPCEIKAKYYPWILGIIFMLLSRDFLGIGLGIFIGYLRKDYLDVWKMLEIFYISDATCERLEDSVLCGGLKSIKVFVWQEETDEIVRPNLTSFEVEEPVEDPQEFVAFRGEGYTLGGSLSSAPYSVEENKE